MIITLCGSTRFEKEYRAIERGLALDRHLVFTVSWYKGMDIEESIKDNLDSVHLEKIAKSDAIVVINKDGYIGDSTRREINFAVQMMKDIYYLEAPNMDDEKIRDIVNKYGFDNRVARWLAAGTIEPTDEETEAEVNQIMKAKTPEELINEISRYTDVEFDKKAAAISLLRILNLFGYAAGAGNDNKPPRPPADFDDPIRKRG